ncbi:Rha family transcriptional regulator [Ignatzschineria rhizosphaerae]|uniref:Rha family transcriptional regulator n=1 Tax=Ignatzschineria rhizosphaerae TaxID=2923279 RepID=A0ABY3X5C9_9GAMM|nr:Rha family transcriptional regulator [Ignatzschineria rhizosphaerae]UNM95956.1 Rha family transcriptional regulator [Ignatzschineria rhizosphaerae]
MLNENVANQTNEVAELDLVFISDKEVMTDSLLIARRFEKRHDYVLRSISKLLKNNAGLKGLPTFEESSYLDSQGKVQPKYLLTKDAMILLVMGYTGKKAMEFKIDYINAFNVMYEHIKTQASLQDRLFAAMQEEDVSAAKGSLGGTLMQERKVEKPILRAKIEDLISLMQGDIDYKSTDNKKIH